MDDFKWTKLMVNWVNSTEFIIAEDDLDDVDYLSFYNKMAEQYNKEHSIKLNSNLNNFFKEYYPKVSPTFKYKAENLMERIEHLQVLSVFMYFAYCDIPCKSIMTLRSNLTISDEIVIARFLLELKKIGKDNFNLDSFRKAIETAIDIEIVEDELALKPLFPKIWEMRNDIDFWRFGESFNEILLLFQVGLKRTFMLSSEREIKMLLEKLSSEKSANQILIQRLENVDGVRTNVENQLSHIQTFVEQKKLMQEKLQNDLKKSKIKNNALIDEIDELKEESEKAVETLTSDNKKLQLELSTLKQNFQTLLTDHENLKKDFRAQEEFHSAEMKIDIVENIVPTQKFGAIGKERNQRPFLMAPPPIRLGQMIDLELEGLQFISGLQEFQKLQQQSQPQPTSQDSSKINFGPVPVPVPNPFQPPINKHDNQVAPLGSSTPVRQPCTAGLCAKARKYKNIIAKLDFDVKKLIEEKATLSVDYDSLKYEYQQMTNQTIMYNDRTQRERNELFGHYIDSKRKIESLSTQVSKLVEELTVCKSENERMKQYQQMNLTWMVKPSSRSQIVYNDNSKDNNISAIESFRRLLSGSRRTNSNMSINSNSNNSGGSNNDQMQLF